MQLESVWQPPVLMRRAKTYLGLLAIPLAAGCICCMGQDVPPYIQNSNWTDTRDSRRSQAAEWLGEISKLDNQIPTLSPAEKAWLKVEYDDELAREGRLTPRAIRAFQSKEGLARSTKPVTSAMVSVLQRL